MKKYLEWLLSLDGQKRTLVLLLIAIGTLSLVIRLFYYDGKSKDTQHNTDTSALVSCEARNTFILDSCTRVINGIYAEQFKELKEYKLKSDSIITNQREAIEKTNKIIQSFK